MNFSDAVKLIKEIHDNGLFKDDEISSYLDSKKAINSKEDLMEFLHAADQSAWFPEFIKNHLLECASKNKKFHDLIKKIAKNSNISYYLTPLTELYMKEPETAIWLISNLEKIKDENMSSPLGYLYGGMGKEKPKMLFKMISLDMTTVQKIAFTIAVNVASVKRKIPNSVVDFVISLSNSEIFSVKQAAISTMALALISSKKVQKHLINLAKTGNDETKMMVMCDSFPQHARYKNVVFKILEECSKTNSPDVIRKASVCLGTFASKRPLECIKITRRWSKEKQSLHGSYESWFLEKIGKDKMSKIHDFMSSWIRNERDVAIKIIWLPSILAQVYQADDMALVKLLGTLNYKNKHMVILIHSTLKKFLAGGHKKICRSDEFFKDAEKILLNIAKHKKIDVKPDTNLKNQLIRMLALIRKIEATKKNPSIKDAKKNLKKFPHIIRVLGENNLDDLISNQKFHPLVVFYQMHLSQNL